MKCLIPFLLAAIPALSSTIPFEGSLPLYLQNLEQQNHSGFAPGLVDSLPWPLAMQWVPYMPDLTPEYIEAARTAWRNYETSDPRLLEETVRQTNQNGAKLVVAPSETAIFETFAILEPEPVTTPEPGLGLFVGAALLFLAGVRRR